MQRGIVKKKKLKKALLLLDLFLLLCFTLSLFFVQCQASDSRKLVQRQVTLDSSNVLVASDFTLRSFIFSSSACIANVSITIFFFTFWEVFSSAVASFCLDFPH